MVIKRADRLMGIKFWAMHYTQMKPRFEVFRYVGYQLDSGTHYFQSLTKGNVIRRSIYQITESDSFKPFCFNRDTIEPGVLNLEEKRLANL